MRIHNFVALALCFCSAQVLAERLGDNDLAQSALRAALRAGTEEAVDRESIRYRNDAERTANLLAEDKKVYSTLVFASGKTSKEVQAFVEEHDLELVRAEAKNAIGENGREATISVGGRDFMFLPGTIAEKIDRAVGSWQYRLGSSIQGRTDEDSALLAETAFKGPLKVYAIEVIGEAGAFREVVTDQAIAGIILAEDEEKIKDHESTKEFVRSAIGDNPRVIRFNPEEGLPPGIDPARLIRMGGAPSALVNPDNSQE
jgi:hypothetical protein